MELRVLSLFDGISCGRLALERAGHTVSVYYASEIDPNAIKVTMKHYPDTIQLGDINDINFEEYIDKVDMIIGGSPCVDLSLAGKRAGLKGERSGLFYKFVEAVNTIKPKYFLLENNYGMPKEAYAEMSKLMGCYPVLINSALVSAQNRKRYYWTNIKQRRLGLVGLPTVTIPQPEDKGIYLKDILEPTVNIQGSNVAEKYLFKNLKSDNDKAVAVTASSWRGIGTDGTTTVMALYNQFNQATMKEKAATIGTNPHCATAKTGQVVVESLKCINVPETVRLRVYPIDTDKLKSVLREHKKYSNKEIAERLDVPMTKVEHWFRCDDFFAIPDEDIWFPLKELLDIQTDEFDKAITTWEEKPSSYDKASRKYYTEGKMSTLTTSNNDEIITPVKETQQGQRIYTVKDGQVVFKEGKGSYKIDLPDGDYLIRKLTPLECERLQTLPDGYTEGISNSNRYKAIGNGWTVDVIAHIFSFIGE